MGSTWQIVITTVGGLLTAFIAGAFSVRLARKTPFEVLQSLLTITDDGNRLDDTDRATLKVAAQREVRRIGQLNDARREGFWAYQRERIRIALQLDTRHREKRSSLTLVGLLFVVSWIFLIFQWYNTTFGYFAAKGQIGQLVSIGPVFVAILLASIGVAAWSAARLGLAATRWLLRSIHVLPVYLLLTALAIMLGALVIYTRPVLDQHAILGFAVIPVLVAAIIFAWLRIELRLLRRYRAHPSARRRLRARLVRRRTPASATMAAWTLAALVLIVFSVAISIPAKLNSPTPAPTAVMQWGGYSAVVDGGYAQIEQAAVDPAHRDRVQAPVTLVYAISYEKIVGGRTMTADEVGFMTTTEKVEHTHLGPARMQSARTFVEHDIKGFMICERPDSFARCSEWKWTER
ncbi:hypothetical protein [Nocardia sp. NPDC051832]|uniref:hypothetical protein n=1 Tax=Nocardia sp. NPDC051832 TaxID=3155673 RepID=UPI00342B6C79